MSVGAGQVLREMAGQQVRKQKGNHKTKTKRGRGRRGEGGWVGGGDGSKPTIHKLYLPGQVIFLLSPLKPIEEKFKESLTKGAKVTGDEETLMNRRELNKMKKLKKGKLAEYRPPPL